MEILLIVAIAALAFVSALRRSHERSARYKGYYVSTSYRAKMARASRVR
jgi:hypothetical protein